MQKTMQVFTAPEFDSEMSNRGIAASIGQYGRNWPVVYILSNEREAYIGETVDVYSRMAQHYDNPERRRLKEVHLITGETFNKSVALDLEAFLISHMGSDKDRKDHVKQLQNGNAGQQKHNYYKKAEYEKQFKQVWEQLRVLGLATQGISEIQNSNIFKYSPYKSLTEDQYQVCFDIVKQLAQDLQFRRKRPYMVEGGPGTGKTILAVYLMKLLTTKIEDDTGARDESLVENLRTIQFLRPNLKIGLVISMKNLRSIVKDTFSKTYGLKASMVLSPSEVASSPQHFDILIVDEAHRLKTARNIGAEIGSFYNANEQLGLDRRNGTQLDWIIQKSDQQIFFYDSGQSIRRTDVDAERFAKIRQDNDTQTFQLTSQLRCGKDGQEYVKYIKSIFSATPPQFPKKFKQYDLKLFKDVREMTDAIKTKDKSLDLCRNLAGYAWKWNTKGRINPQNPEETDACISRGLYDIDINGEKYIWNVKYDGWVNTSNAVNEVGCVHTIQGFDLNYAGVIIGNELKYDFENHRFYIDKDNYFDINGKNKTEESDLLQYILNIYIILCTRGMCGTYIYACDKGVREYLSQYIPIATL